MRIYVKPEKPKRVPVRVDVPAYTVAVLRAQPEDFVQERRCDLCEDSDFRSLVRPCMPCYQDQWYRRLKGRAA